MAQTRLISAKIAAVVLALSRSDIHAHPVPAGVFTM